jgi:hypothetical protein
MSNQTVWQLAMDADFSNGMNDKKVYVLTYGNAQL